jgi:thiol:disulfide interchange protein DsbD
VGKLPSATPAISVLAPTSPTDANWGASFWLALITALVGGLVLNLMPCVLPVLAIKVVALGLPGTSPRQRRRDGAAYSAGVVFTFVALGAAVLMFRAAGEQLGWGFQLQSPLFVSALALLFTALALNLMGLFEWGQLWPAAWGGWQSQRPAVNAFASGVLAVGLASPCTAPFVGVSMGWALSQDWPSALAVLAAMGVGMALPYALLSLWPAMGKFLPQPGAWMSVFKTLMAFPLWITVVWLLWVLGQQTSLDAAMAMLLVLLATAALIWAWGLQKPARQWLVLLSFAAWLTCAWVTWPRLNAPEEPSRSVGSTWQSWSSLAVKDRLDQGQAVFVDFTAAWCVTCQLNKQTTLSHPDVLREFERQNISLMRADWTRRDPSITRALAELGRSGVPVYVLYKPGQAPLVLSELLSPTLVLNTLKQR